MLDFDVGRLIAALAFRDSVINLSIPVGCWLAFGLIAAVASWKLRRKSFAIAVLLVCIALPIAMGLLAAAVFYPAIQSVHVVIGSGQFALMLTLAQIAAVCGLLIYAAPTKHRWYLDREAAHKRLSVPH